MAVDDEFQERIRMFVAGVKEQFSYLESDYGFSMVDEGTSGTGHYPDAMAFVRYVGKGVGVEVLWYFSSQVVGVGLAEAPFGTFPDHVWYMGQKRPAGVDLYQLVRVLHPEAVGKFLLNRVDDTSMRYMKQRHKVISSDMDGVIRNLAEMLETYGAEVLRGDTSAIPQVRDAIAQP